MVQMLNDVKLYKYPIHTLPCWDSGKVKVHSLGMDNIIERGSNLQCNVRLAKEFKFART